MVADLQSARPSIQRCRRGTARYAEASELKPTDVAVLQYTGGTTGVSKGAVAQQRDYDISFQSEAWNYPCHGSLAGRCPAGISVRAAACITSSSAALMNMMLGSARGRNLLIPNPVTASGAQRNVKHKIPGFPAVAPV
jgi:long-chain acyl-CoA synthetase